MFDYWEQNDKLGDLDDTVNWEFPSSENQKTVCVMRFDTMGELHNNQISDASDFDDAQTNSAP